jgi:hypothetical protein
MRPFLACVVICAVAGPAARSGAALIILANLGEDTADDIEYNIQSNIGTLFTRDDPGAAHGDQSTAVDFVGLLSSMADIPAGMGSLSLNGFVATGPAMTFPGYASVIQDFSGGTLELYDAANALLLSANLFSSGLNGPTMSPGKGGLFTAYVTGVITGGSLADQLRRHTIRVDMHLPLIASGIGFSMIPGSPANTGRLNPFTADAEVEISAELIPEPSSAVVLIAGSAALAAVFRRKRRA